MDGLQYDKMVEGALRSVVTRALEAVVEHGLPGQHHFYITFETTAEGVDIPEFLHKQYPEEMTIVLQHQFWDLAVDNEHFEVTLSFSGAPQKLYIPLMAVTSFFDPSVQFGLRFGDGGEALDGEMGEGMPLPDPQNAEADVMLSEENESSDATADDGEPKSGEVVNLDAFRKKT